MEGVKTVVVDLVAVKPVTSPWHPQGLRVGARPVYNEWFVGLMRSGCCVVPVLDAAKPVFSLYV